MISQATLYQIINDRRLTSNAKVVAIKLLNEKGESGHIYSMQDVLGLT